MKNSLAICIDSDAIYNKYLKESNSIDTLYNSVLVHEAGFDAYMAGYSFLCIWKYKEIGDVMENKQKLKELNQKEKNLKGSKRK